MPNVRPCKHPSQPFWKNPHETLFLGDKITLVDTATDKVNGEITGFDKLVGMLSAPLQAPGADRAAGQ